MYMFQVQIEDGLSQAPKHVAVTYVENTLYFEVYNKLTIYT